MKTQSQISLPRRRFVQGLALGAAGLGLGLNARQLLASQGHTGAPTLTGDTFHLTLGGTDVNITGKTRPATTINGSIPGPTLRWKEGDTITLKVTNLLPETSSIHWHGILLPFQMDGVPGLSFDGIAPGEALIVDGLMAMRDGADIQPVSVEISENGVVTDAKDASSDES